MVIWAVLIAGLLLPPLAAGVLLLVRPGIRSALPRVGLSPVALQHLHLFQGGRLSETAVASAKQELHALLTRDAVAEAEATLRPGLQFAVRVRALAELGTQHAAPILARQLGRKLTDDPVEQSWYWIDVANGLRQLNASEALEPLLNCPAAQSDVPLEQFYAAETACCAGFIDRLKEPGTALGRSALRVLYRALRGLRFGVPPRVLADGRLGAAVCTAWKYRGERLDPIVTLIILEALRQNQRAGIAQRVLAGETPLLDAVNAQLALIAARAEAFAAALENTAAELPRRLLFTPAGRRGDLFLALDELRVDAADLVLQLLPELPADERGPAVRLLRWSRRPMVTEYLVQWAEDTVRPGVRAARQPSASVPARGSIRDAIPYAELLYTLRGHSAPDSEALLVTACSDWDPTYRAAAAGSLGWWDPFDSTSVIMALNRVRSDANAQVRRAGEAALARLGERKALSQFRLDLTGEGNGRIQDVIYRVADEGLSLLWPDLDALADGEDTEVAGHASEALLRLRETFFGVTG